MRRPVLFILSLAVLACGPPSPDFEELCRRTQASPFTQVVEQKPYEIRMGYRPAWLSEARALEDLAQEEEFVTAEAVDAVLRGAVQSIQFVLEIGPHAELAPNQKRTADIVNFHPDQNAFSANLHHLIYGLGERIYLLTAENERVPVGLYQLDRNWGLGYTNRILLSFPAEYNEIDLRREPRIEVVVQNLNRALPELRFLFDPNPIRKGDYSPQKLARALNQVRSASP